MRTCLKEEPELADPRGTLGTHPPSPISFIFMQFSTGILPNNRLLPKIQALASRLHLGNPGSTTVTGTRSLQEVSEQDRKLHPN